MNIYKELEKNFPKIEKFFTEQQLLEFYQTAPNDLEKFNVGPGTLIRVHLLQPRNVLYKAYIQNGTKDRAAMVSHALLRFYIHYHAHYTNKRPT